MSKDMVSSWEQKQWEFSAARHKRAAEALSKGSSSDQLNNYWKSIKDEAEQKYPILKKETYEQRTTTARMG